MNMATARFLVGLRVKIDHPITPLNPTETFIIVDAHCEANKIYVRGAHTMWFEGTLITLVS